MTTVAPLPDEFIGQFGPQLTALIAYLTVVCRMPRLVVQRFLEGILQIPISLGSTQHAWEETSAAVAAPYQDLQDALADQPVLNGDETGHRTNGAKRWLWTLVAPTFIFYTIATSRGADVLQRLLRRRVWRHPGPATVAYLLDLCGGPPPTVLVAFSKESIECPRAGDDDLGQTLLSRGPDVAAATVSFVVPLSCRSACPRAPFTRGQLITNVRPIERRFFALAERHVNAADADVSNLARALFVHHPISLPSSTRRAWNRPTISPNVPYERLSSGERSCLARGAPKVKSPSLACSP